METCRAKPDSWASLPDDIILNILSRLPLIHFLRARSVCSSWNRLASDPSFARLLSASHPSPPASLPGFALFLASESSSSLLYLDLNDPSVWRSLPLSFLPDAGAGSELLASCRGLLLLRTPLRDLLVVNPATRRWRKLPPMDSIRDPFYTGLTVDPATGDFTVAVAESELQHDAATEIFESKTGRWRTGARPSRAGRWKRVASSMSTPWFHGSVPVCCKPVYCRGAFYHLTWGPEKMVSELDVGAGAWRYEKGSGAIPGGVPWGVMEEKGKVVMLEMSYCNANSVLRGDGTLLLWELQRDRLQWVPAGCVPPPPKSEYRVHRWRRFAIGDGFICTTFLVAGTIVTFASHSEEQCGMVYDCASSKWLPMPHLPGTPFDSTSCLTSFTASLHPL